MQQSLLTETCVCILFWPSPQVLFQLNFLTICVCLTLGTAYGAYYMVALLSGWFLFSCAFLKMWPALTPAKLEGKHWRSGPQHFVDHFNSDIQTIDTLMVWTINQLQLWQSRVEIEHYSVTYFDHIAAFKAPYHWTSVKGGAHMRFIGLSDIHASTKHVWAPPLTEVQRYGTSNAAM